MNIPIILKELAKISAITLTEETVKTFVETKIKPIFVNWGKNDLRSVELEDCLSEYLLRCYAYNNNIPTIVFGKLQKTLDDLYIPLTLEEYRNEDKKWILDENCYDILDSYSRLLIIDKAGMGKSTIVKYFACQGINLDKTIPIVIELRRLEKNQSILEYIQKKINSLDKNIKIEEIVEILKKGDFVIFFDGYDEVTNEDKPDVLDAIQEFTSKAFNTKIVITSREEEDLNSLGEYKCVNIKPLTEDEAYKLIEKYDNNGNISKELIKRLREDSSMDILSEFLENPLLVSLLYKTFEYKEEIPYKKIDFYEQVYNSLFNDHDKTKGSAYVHEKNTKLDRYQFEQTLRAFGLLSLKEDKVEYSDPLIHDLLIKAIDRFSWLKINVEDFLYDITHAVPFIQKDGTEYKWVHKSFMEYFAGCFICYDNKEAEEKYLKKMISINNSMKYYNVLDFCYDMDTLGFRRYAILPYIRDYVKKYNMIYVETLPNIIDEQYSDIIKSILAMNINIFVIKFSEQDIEIVKNGELNVLKEMRRFINALNLKLDVNKMSASFYETANTNCGVLCDMNPICSIMQDKMPEIFKDIEQDEKDEVVVNDTIYFNFSDIINVMNKMPYLFFDVVNKVVNTISSTYGILDYKKCRELLEGIELEEKISNEDIFDL